MTANSKQFPPKADQPRAETKNRNKKMIFAGSGYFAFPQIKVLAKNYNLEVITQKNNTPVKDLSNKLKLKTNEVSNVQDLEKTLEKLKPDVLIISDFGIILSKKALNIPSLVLNTHPSLLPKYRGPSPYVSAILNNEKETGVSIISMIEKIDVGPIFVQKKVRIEKDETQISLREKLGKLAADILIFDLEKILKEEIKPVPQNEKEATYTKIFQKEDGKIDWYESAEVIERKIRAFNPWPGTFTFFQMPKKTLRVKISEANIEKGNQLKPEAIKIENQTLKIKTGKDYLIIRKIQPEGKKEMTAEEFLSGYEVKSTAQG